MHAFNDVNETKCVGMTRELIIFIIIVVVLAPFLFINTRKNKKRSNSRKSRGFMSTYLEEKKKTEKDD